MNRKVPAEETQSGKSGGLGLAGATHTADMGRALEIARRPRCEGHEGNLV